MLKAASLGRAYSTRRMRLQQGVAARVKTAWEPVRSAIEDEPVLKSRLTDKRRLEEKTKPAKRVVHYLQSRLIGRPRSAVERREAWLNMKKRQFAPMFLDQMKPQMKRWCSALTRDQLPAEYLPEIAVVGRSNVGKSTLLNALSARGGARVSSRPGSTQTLDFYKIGKPSLLCLVDLPGYGFAETSEAKRLQWTEFSLEYLRSRKSLKRVLLLLDARWGLFDADREMLAFLVRHRIPYQVVLTKCDLVPVKHLARRLTLLQEELKVFNFAVGPVIPVSAKKKQGMDDLRSLLSSLKLDRSALAQRLSGLQPASSPPVSESAELKEVAVKPKKSRMFLDNEVLPLSEGGGGVGPSTASCSPKRTRRDRPMSRLIGTQAQDVIPKGIAKWRVLGRPESKAPKMRPRVDVNDVVRAVDLDTKKNKKNKDRSTIGGSVDRDVSNSTRVKRAAN